jgi:hypothetical protein
MDFETNSFIFEHVQRNWYLSPSDNLLHFPSSPQHPSHLPKQSSNGVPQSMTTGGAGAEVSAEEEEEIGGELDRNKVVSATLLYAKELESIV